MMASTFQGQRVPDGQWFNRSGDGRLKPGDYGREGMAGEGNTGWWEWFVCCPDDTTTRLWVNEDDQNGNRHVVTEHEDGTISVEGSILGRSGFHGHLRRGVWSPA